MLLKYKDLINFFYERAGIVCVLLLFFISVVMCWPLFRNEFPFTHDFVNSLMKHLAMRDFFGRGQFLPVWVPDYYYGYGGAVFNFYPPLFSFLSASVGWLGVPSALAINLASFLVVFLSGWAMFVFLKELTSRSGAFLGAAAYMMAPYHTVDLYIRGAHSELVAFVFMPLILWGIRKVIKDPCSLYFCMTALSVAGLLLSHGTTALFFLPIAILYLMWLGFVQNEDKLRNFCLSLFAIFSGLALAAFSIFPAIFEHKYLDTRRFLNGHFDYHGHFLYPSQFLFSSDQCAFFKLPTLTMAVPFHFGWIYFFGFCVGILCVCIFMSREIKNTYLFFLVLLLITLGMMTVYSKAIWEGLSILKGAQFPWRLLAPASFFICVLISAPGSLPNDKYRRIICVLGVMLILFTRLPDFKSPGWRNWPKATSYGELRTIEPLPRDFQPLTAKHELTVPPDHVMDFPKGAGEILSHQQRSPVAHTFEVLAQTPAMACFYNYYFPGWEIYIDGQRASFLDNEYGLMLFLVSPGRHHIDIHFAATPVRIVGAWISMFCLMCMILALIVGKVFRIPSKSFGIRGARW